MEPTFRVRLWPPAIPIVMERSRRSVTAAMVENSPGRSDPRIGGAEIGLCVRVCFFLLVLGGREIVMVVVLVGLWEGVERGLGLSVFRGKVGGEGGQCGGCQRR